MEAWLDFLSPALFILLQEVSRRGRQARHFLHRERARQRFEEGDDVGDLCVAQLFIELRTTHDAHGLVDRVNLAVVEVRRRVNQVA